MSEWTPELIVKVSNHVKELYDILKDEDKTIHQTIIIKLIKTYPNIPPDDIRRLVDRCISFYQGKVDHLDLEAVLRTKNSSVSIPELFNSASPIDNAKIIKIPCRKNKSSNYSSYRSYFSAKDVSPIKYSEHDLKQLFIHLNDMQMLLYENNQHLLQLKLTIENLTSDNPYKAIDKLKEDYKDLYKSKRETKSIQLNSALCKKTIEICKESPNDKDKLSDSVNDALLFFVCNYNKEKECK